MNCFEMFAIAEDDTVVGMVSLYEHGKNIISCGPEVFEEYRKQGYGVRAVCEALNIARDRGYEIAVAQIRKDNQGSLRLHEKLGFEMEHEYINRRGNEVCFYIKYIGG